MENINKNAKIIGIGNEGIKNLDSIYNVVKNNVDIEKININQDVDKEYVRQLLDGVDILLLTYSTLDKRAVDIVKAISFMAGERRVLSIGFNSSQKEHKEELGLNREFIINDDNCSEIMNLMNMMIESVSYDCMVSLDLTDLKELFATEQGLKYSYKSFDKSFTSDKISEELLNNLKEIKSDFTEKKGIMFVEMVKGEESLDLLNEVLTKVQENSTSTYEIIFSLYLKEDTNNQIKIGLICN